MVRGQSSVSAIDGLNGVGRYLSRGAKLGLLFGKCPKADLSEAWRGGSVPNLPLYIYNFPFIQVRGLRIFAADPLPVESGRFGTSARAIGLSE